MGYIHDNTKNIKWKQLNKKERYKQNRSISESII